MSEPADRRELVCELIAQLKWGGWHTVDELREGCDMHKWSMRKWLEALEASGLVTKRRRKTGTMSTPYEYALNDRPFEVKQ